MALSPFLNIAKIRKSLDMTFISAIQSGTGNSAALYFSPLRLVDDDPSERVTFRLDERKLVNRTIRIRWGTIEIRRAAPLAIQTGEPIDTKERTMDKGCLSLHDL